MGRKSKHKPNKTSGRASRVGSAKCAQSLEKPIAKTTNGSGVGEPLGIIDRLGLPVYRPRATIDEDEDDLQLDFRVRPYFASSLCCLCSKPCADLETPCDKCRMVSYCSPRHREQHSESHGQLCAVLARICRSNGGLALAESLDADAYRGLRVQLLSIAEAALGRPMELCEREIVLYPRLCRVCHGSRNLVCCPDCKMEFFCSGGGIDHRVGHSRHCAEYRVFGNILQSQGRHGFAVPRIPNAPLEEGREPPADFDSLVRDLFEGYGYAEFDCGTYAALSQAASPALTAFHALRAVGTIDELVRNRSIGKSLKVHVIGAELQFECANLGVWEKLFLHFLPGVRNLKLEFCGPELQVPAEIAEILEHPRLCASCRANKRAIEVVFHCGKLYHQVESDKPDLVCLFNPGLYRTTGFANQDTWPRTIEKFCDSGAPILVTSYTEVELPRDLARIREFRPIRVDLEPHRNPFASLRPERNFVSDDVAPLIYKNYFLSVVRGLPGGIIKQSDAVK